MQQSVGYFKDMAFVDLRTMYSDRVGNPVGKSRKQMELALEKFVDDSIDNGIEDYKRVKADSLDALKDWTEIDTSVEASFEGKGDVEAIITLIEQGENRAVTEMLSSSPGKLEQVVLAAWDEDETEEPDKKEVWRRDEYGNVISDSAAPDEEDESDEEDDEGDSDDEEDQEAIAVGPLDFKEAFNGRLVGHRLYVGDREFKSKAEAVRFYLEQGEEVRNICKMLGISYQHTYNIKTRYEQEGDPGSR